MCVCVCGGGGGGGSGVMIRKRLGKKDSKTRLSTNYFIQIVGDN